MPLKTVEIEGKTYALVQDGKPVYISDDGKEHVYDAEAMRGSLTRLENDLASTKRKAAATEDALKSFDGLDAEEAKEALEKIGQIDAKKLVDAGDMDAAIAAAVKPLKDDLASKDKTIETLQGSLSAEKIGNQFSQSKFVTEKLTPAGADLIKNIYADKLKIEEGRIVGLDPAGQPIRSASNPADLAGFDEIIESFVDAYPHKDHILKGNDNHGGGGKPNNGKAGNKTLSRSEFDGLNPADQMSKIKDGFKVVDAT